MRIGPLTVLLLVGCTLAACDQPAPRPLLERQCVSMTAGEPADIAIRARDAGMIRMAVEPHGIAVVASIPTASGMPASAISPVDRLGLITLVAPVRSNGALTLRLESRDWRGIRGDVCVSADLLPRAARRTRAEREFASGALATHAGDWPAAFDHYAAAAREFTRLDLHTSSGAAYHAMAELAIMRLDRESDAVRLARSALAAYGRQASGAVRGTLEAIEARAAVYTRDVAVPAELVATQALIDEARRSLAATPDGTREALRLTVLEGFLAYRVDAPERADDLFAQAMKDCRAASDWECHGIAAQNTAVLAEARKSFPVALETYEAAMSHLDPAIAPELTADILDNMGRLQRAAGLVSESDASHAAALRLYVRLNDCDAVRRTLARIGALHAQVGSFEDAMDELHRAATLSCEDLFATLGKQADGPAYAERSSAHLCAKVLDAETLSIDGRSAVLHALLALREAALLAGDAETAQRCMAYADPFAGNSRLKMRVANARGEILLERGEPMAARLAFTQARSIADAAQLSPTYEHRGRAMLGQARASLLAADALDAQRWALRALRAGSARADVLQSVESLRLLAAAFRHARQTQRASRTLATAVELIESVPIDELDGEVRATWLASQHAVFADLTELLASASRNDGDVWTAFSVAERGRARSFKYALSQASKAGAAASPQASAARDEMLSQVSDLFRGSEDDLDDFIRRLDQLPTSTFAALTARERGQLHHRLRRLDAALVQYATGPRTMFAFIIDANGIHMVRLGEREAIVNAAVRLAELLRVGEPVAETVADAARELAREAWWPIARFVSAKRVLVAPDDALHFVPFAALPWSEEPADRLLVHRVEIATVPSALFIAGPHRTVSGAGRDLAFLGDPVFRTAEWQRRCATDPNRGRQAVGSDEAAWTEWMPSLPASRHEVLAIAALARKSSGRRVETFLGCEATGDALRRATSSEHALLHVATHGRIDVRRPRLSALALTPKTGAPRDASFGLLEILDLKIDARLVTLSACETSGGRLLRGEGVLGPAQAFLQAGASSVVASYRRVEDAATARFMRALYERLLEENMSIAEALRTTQLAEQTSGPSYSWAAFALYGMPDTRI